MNKTEHNFWLDVIISASFLLTGISGLLLWLVIPHQLDMVFPGFSRSVWVAVHICFGAGGARWDCYLRYHALGLAQGFARTLSWRYEGKAAHQSRCR
jgi:hypothetical protein